tara:strand:- start:433 stop:2547 length:2115 start_codon:yes stop_codon:yes gene_type:complete
MNRYPAKPMMDEMAKYGRYGDTMLVHMNPAEVAGIASLVPGGRLTTNPVTGQPEAFLPLLLGFAAKGLGLSALGTGALVGAGTAAVTGDLKRGILSGLTAGFGAGIGEAASVGDPILSEAAAQGQSALADATTVLSDADMGGATIDAFKNLSDSQITDMGLSIDPSLSTEAGSSLGGFGETVEGIRASVPDAFKSGTGIGEGISQNLGLTGNIAGAGIAAGTMEQDRIQEQFARQEMARLGEAEADRKEAFDDLQRGYMAAQPGIPMGLASARSEMSRRTPPPMFASEGGSTTTGRREDDNPYAQQYADLGAARDIARFMGGPRGYMGVDPVTVQQRLRGQDVIAPPRDYMPGFEPEFNYFQNLERDDDGNIIGTPQIPDRSYRPMRQGVISRSQYFDPVLQSPQSNAQMNEYRRTLEKLDPGPLGQPAVMGLAAEGSVLSPMQQNVFESVYAAPPPVVTPPVEEKPADKSATDQISIQNMSAEELAEKFPNLTPEQIQAIANLDYSNMFRNFDGGFNLFAEGGQTPEKMPEVGPAPDVTVKTSMMEGKIPGGGIATIPTEFTQQEGMPSEQELSMLADALLGRTDTPDPIVNMFIERYGPDMFRQAREMILQSVVPNAQTEGMIRGNGSGMDDRVQGMIGKDQPVAVSPGEYIVAADVVSGLGEGSSDAGAKELDKMMDKVRMERNGTTKQAPRIDERKVMPA